MPPSYRAAGFNLTFLDQSHQQLGICAGILQLQSQNILPGGQKLLLKIFKFKFKHPCSRQVAKIVLM